MRGNVREVARLRPPQPALWLAAIVVVTMVSASCSTLLDFDECSKDADCAALAADGQTLVCSVADGYCVEGTPDVEPECESDADCTEEPNTICSPDMVCVAPPATCINSECAAMGPNMVCGRGNICVSATSPECTYVAGPITADDIFFIGSILPTSGANTDTGKPQENAVTLAVEEFNFRAPFDPLSLRAVHIGCNDMGNREIGVMAAEHLTGNVGVQAIVGPGFSSVYIEVVTQVTTKEDVQVFTISGSATSAAITTLPDNDLAWRTAATDAFQSVAIAERVQQLQQAAGRPINVLGFGKNDAYGLGLLESVGELLLDESNIEFTPQTHPDPSIGDCCGTAVTEGLAAEPDPDVVLLLGTGETLDILELVENNLEPLPGTGPTYIMSDGGKLPDLSTLIGADTDLRLRVEGTAPNTENTTDSLGASFRNRYRSRFSEDPVRFSANAYDGAVLILYSRIALDAQDLPFTGPNIAEVFKTRFSDPEASEINSNPSSIPNARNLLTTGNNFDYVGASGPLDFDPETGEAPGNVDRWIVVADGDFENCGLFQPDVGAWTPEAVTRCGDEQQ